MNFFNSKFFRLLLPILGCGLAIVFLVSLLSPVITRLKADRNPYNREITLAENSGQSSQPQALRKTASSQIRFSDSGSINLPRPHKEVKEEEELMDSANDASTSLQGYMPSLGGP